jgi:microcystin-dependent protein
MNPQHRQRGHLPPGLVPPGFGDAPVGAVIAFAGQIGAAAGVSPPASVEAGFPVTDPIEAWGWTACDGRSVAIADYVELYLVLGTLYGGDDTHFRLPDYRGYFLRGVDAGAGNDPDAAARTNAAGSGATPACQQIVGSRQPDAIQKHDHIYGAEPTAAAPAQGAGAAGAPSSTPTLTTSGPTDSLSAPGQVRVSQSETRPRNIYVHYLIKFTYGLPWQAFDF